MGGEIHTVLSVIGDIIKLIQLILFLAVLYLIVMIKLHRNNKKIKLSIFGRIWIRHLERIAQERTQDIDDRVRKVIVEELEKIKSDSLR